MRHSQGPPGTSTHDEPFEYETRRQTPSIGLTRDSDKPTDSSNEDFLFHLYRGSELLQDNRVHEAKEELERALHLQPRDSKGQDLIAVVYFRLGLYPRAIQIYEALRRKNANDTALLLNLALCYLKTGQPDLARKDLEHLLAQNPTHSRAWGYLGLACERVGDLVQAERAFAQGGHHQMARRMSARIEGASIIPLAPAESQPTREVREVAGAAYQELDAGELSFALAEPTSERSNEDGAAQSWRPHELGQLRASERAAERTAPDRAPERLETRRPDTRDGAPIVSSVPQLGHSQSLNRRPTLIAPVGAPPAHEMGAVDYAALERIPSQRPPSIGLDDAGIVPAPSVRHPVVAVPSPFGPAKSHEAQPNVHSTRTLLPPLGAPASGAPPPPAPVETLARAPSEAPSVAPSTPLGIGPTAAGPPHAPHAGGAAEAPGAAGPVRFPDTGVALHASGLALVRTTAEIGFAARLESIRAQQSGLEMRLVERRVKGKSSGESFGGATSPMVLASGDGQLVLAARPGRKLAAFAVGGEMCFAREDVLLGFGGGLSFENGRLATGEGESVQVVQLRGDGSVLLEAIGEILTLAVRPDRSLSVRREVIFGWFGRLVPRALSPSDAPCGQRGLVSFAGEGKVLVTST
ncbi:MAG: tetratricopeptide repeat protein [Labilithrix sp.]|nr:tetratricopeptide repeat protein [Labilithrix sp.]